MLHTDDRPLYELIKWICYRINYNFASHIMKVYHQVFHCIQDY